MSAPRLDFHPDFREELRSAWWWYKGRRERAAAAFIRRVDQALDEIEAHPRRARKHRSGTRAVLLHPYSYRIVYQASAREVFIVAVAHTSRRAGYWRDRLK